MLKFLTNKCSKGEPVCCLSRLTSGVGESCRWSQCGVNSASTFITVLIHILLPFPLEYHDAVPHSCHHGEHIVVFIPHNGYPHSRVACVGDSLWCSPQSSVFNNGILRRQSIMCFVSPTAGAGLSISAVTRGRKTFPLLHQFLSLWDNIERDLWHSGPCWGNGLLKESW